MTCELNASALHAYFDNELDAVRAAEFERHLETCPDCKASLQKLSALRNDLHKSDLYQVASSRLRSQISQQIASESRGTGLRWKLWIPAFSVAVFVIALAAGVLFLQPHSHSARLQAELIDAHIRSLQANHLTDVQSTDQHTVKPWFDGKLEFIPPVSDFSQQGFPLIGGRLDFVGGHNVAALVYGRRKHVINLFAWPAADSSVPLNGNGSRAGYNWLGWKAGDMQFCLVSDASPEDLRQLQALIHP